MIAELERVKNVWPQVKSVLSVPSNAREYNKLCRVMDDLVDEVGENENHRLAPLLDTIGSLLEVYEEEQILTSPPISIGSCSAVLKNSKLDIQWPKILVVTPTEQISMKHLV